MGVHSDKPSGPQSPQVTGTSVLLCANTWTYFSSTAKFLKGCCYHFPFPSGLNSDPFDFWRREMLWKNCFLWISIQMPHNILYKKIFVHNSFYKFMSRRMARGTLTLHTPNVALCKWTGMPSWFLSISESAQASIKLKLPHTTPSETAPENSAHCHRLASRTVLETCWAFNKELHTWKDEF